MANDNPLPLLPEEVEVFRRANSFNLIRYADTGEIESIIFTLPDSDSSLHTIQFYPEPGFGYILACKMDPSSIAPPGEEPTVAQASEKLESFAERFTAYMIERLGQAWDEGRIRTPTGWGPLLSRGTSALTSGIVRSEVRFEHPDTEPNAVDGSQTIWFSGKRGGDGYSTLSINVNAGTDPEVQARIVKQAWAQVFTVGVPLALLFPASDAY